MSWIQSKIVPNCPIYYIMDDGTCILKIEYLIDDEKWLVHLLGDKYLIKEKRSAVNEIKKQVVELFKQKITIYQELLNL